MSVICFRVRPRTTALDQHVAMVMLTYRKHVVGAGYFGVNVCFLITPTKKSEGVSEPVALGIIPLRDIR